MTPTEANLIASNLMGKSWREVSHEHEIRKMINHKISEIVIDLDDAEQVKELTKNLNAQETIYAHREIKLIKQQIENGEVWEI